MLDANLAAQLTAHFKKLTRPVTLVACLDDSPKSHELRRLLQQLSELSPKLTFADDGADSRRPSFAIVRDGTDVSVTFAGVPLGHELTSLVLAILASIPGIGTRIATLLVTDLPELGQTDRKAIASLAGLAPHVSQSGNAPPRAMIAGGRPCVRAALYMAALVAARHNPDLRPEYEAMRRAGKPAKVALVAIARKLVVLANALLKDNKTFAESNLMA